ncbi:MAG: TetR/AcrR family transcriptional regulator [Chloroflexi bacterium]|nr:TetR/AcrR family transcriptional regulator [Chloroflexota bacterium]
MPPRPDVRKERRNQILDAATAVFARLGFHRARMDDIVQESGLSKGTLYWYFDSKDDIIAALPERILAWGMKDLQALSRGEGSVRERLLLFTRQVMAEFEHLSGLLPIIYEFYAAAARQETVYRVLQDYVRDYRETLAALIQHGIDQGEFRTVNAVETAIILCALYEGLGILWMVDPQAVNLNELVEHSVRLLLDGLKRHRCPGGEVCCAAQDTPGSQLTQM